MTIAQRHNHAIDLAEKAFALASTDEARARDLFTEAYQIEREIAEGIEARKANEPSRSILYRSAASLALNAELYTQSLAMASAGLRGFPPEEIKLEIQSVFEQATALLAQTAIKTDDATAADLAIIEDWSENALLIEEAKSLDRPILHFALSDAHDHNSISLENLATFTDGWQKMVTNFYKKVYPRSSATIEILNPEYWTMRAFAFTPGSFKLHLEASRRKGLIPTTPLTRVLEVLTAIIETGQEEDLDEELIELLRSYKGHALVSLRNFLGQMVEKGIEVKYKWYDPANYDVYGGRIDIPFANRINHLLHKQTELVRETKTFTGTVRGANDKTGKWLIEDETEGDKKGGTEFKNLLTGVKIGQSYVFTCEEIIYQEEVTMNEKTDLQLIQLKPIK